ncbi:MAG TPA: hypothetical protein VEC15_07415 [Actinomycetota bacterium]|nr:hypothetical protein [Actinomycetota bacterium]
MAWVRVLGVLASVVVLTLVLRQLPALVVLVVVIGGSWWLVRRVRTEQIRDRRSGAELLGLRRETSDPFGIAGYPLQLFGRSEDATVDDVAWGPWRGLEVRAFGASMRAPTVPGTSLTSAPTTSMAAVLANIAEDAPPIVVEPQVFATMFERPPALAAVTTGDRAFDAVWSVYCDDAGFARALLDDAMRRWLLDLGDTWGVELSARMAMVYAPASERPDVVSVLEILAGFLRRVPEDLLVTRPPAV